MVLLVRKGSIEDIWQAMYPQRKAYIEEEKRLNEKFYLGELLEKEGVKFGSNNLILAPVGSGKSHLIEKQLIPKGFQGKILYLTSNTALKDSLAPHDSEIRKILAENGRSKGFFTSRNKESFGNVRYRVHVMTYHEFGQAIYSPGEELTKDIDLIFCDEIHSLPTFISYAGDGQNVGLPVALRWLFEKHEGKVIYYFTATRNSLVTLEKAASNFLKFVTTYDYLDHPDIRRYESRLIYYVENYSQLIMHLRGAIGYMGRNGKKGLVFSRQINRQLELARLAKDEGYTPLVLWSTNNREYEMTEEQLKARDFILSTGSIPPPYNMLIINASMQEGWNLLDKNVELAVLDTLDETEQIQALGRIRKDINLLVIRVPQGDPRACQINIPKRFLNNPLTVSDKSELIEVLDMRNSKGDLIKWPTAKKNIEERYDIEDSRVVMGDKVVRVSTITNKYNI